MRRERWALKKTSSHTRFTRSAGRKAGMSEQFAPCPSYTRFQESLNTEALWRYILVSPGEMECKRKSRAGNKQFFTRFSFANVHFSEFSFKHKFLCKFSLENCILCAKMEQEHHLFTLFLYEHAHHFQF